MKDLKKNRTMKRLSLYQILGILVTTAILFGACTKENAGVKLPARVITSQFLNVKSDSVTVVGFVVAQGEGVTEKGVCYGTTAAPTIANSKVIFSGPTTGATYNIKIGGLLYATTYYARAYATGPDGTVYGEQVTFNTLPVVPTLSTTTPTGVTGSAASSGGNVTNTGGAAVTARGLCFGTATNPVVTGTKTADGNGAGVFVSALTGLKGNTTYYIRSYATNSAGTGYGPVIIFTTPVDLPVVTTTAVTAVTKTSAVSGGAVTYDGGGTITARGLAWGTTANPTTAGSKIDGGTGTGAFVSNLPVLIKYTTYHVRAYATNSAGTAYGADVEFKTLADILTWNLPGDYVGDSYPGSTLANWSPDKSPQVISTISAGDRLEGYVYMANTSNNWKFASQANWNGPNYGDDNSSGALNPNAANNIASAKGYYKINVNSTTMTYTAIATTWGVIGDATPGGWGSQTNMEYIPATQKFFLAVHLTAGGSFKFRGTSDWSVNYGSDAANGILGAGAGNIPVDTESDYGVWLDLSHPNAYTYNSYRWGVIGDATPGGWGTDTNMTWDNVAKVFKVTLNLTVGSFKFRANDGWDVNYGGSLSGLTPGGDNIAIATAGNYTLTYSPTALTATVTKN